MSDLAPFVDIANQLADLARPIAARYFRSTLAVERKADASPVTIADREIEAAMVAHLRAHCPTHGIYGEEHGQHNLDAEYVWVLDPIDGTKSFITGRPTFGTLIALAHRGTPVVGLIDQPILKERWVGASEMVTTFNGSPVRVRAAAPLSDAVTATTSPAQWVDAWAAHERLVSRVKSMTYGGDCYSYGLLAMGFVDLVVEACLQPYDFMALAPVVHGAGGTMTDWHGAPLTMRSDGRVIAATNLALLTEARAVIAS